jgi:hypothetical protein
MSLNDGLYMQLAVTSPLLMVGGCDGRAVLSITRKSKQRAWLQLKWTDVRIGRSRRTAARPSAALMQHRRACQAVDSFFYRERIDSGRILDENCIVIGSKALFFPRSPTQFERY